MYCANCGAKASGNFCSSCGERLALARAGEETLHPQAWQDESRYALLIDVDEVRDMIARHAVQAQDSMSGDDFLDLCDTAFVPLVGVSLSRVARIAVPIYSRVGIRTGKTRRKVLSAPIGRVIVGAVCSLARRGRQLKRVHQGEDGCVLEAVLPSDMWSWEGALVVSVQRDGAGVVVEAGTKIAGQLFDWGKSKQCLNQLFEDLESLLH